MRLTLATLALLTILAGTAPAQTVPFLADVTGVAADDALNIREHPRGSAQRLGELAPDARNLEVVALSDSGDWAQVNFGEQTGWVAARFLTSRTRPLLPGTFFDNGLICFGTEPFWALTARRGTAEVTFSRADGPDRRFKRLYVGNSANMGPYAQALLAEDAKGRMTGSLRSGTCSNGMSDNLYALEFDVLVEGGDGPVLLSGCCSLQAE